VNSTLILSRRYVSSKVRRAHDLSNTEKHNKISNLNIWRQTWLIASHSVLNEMTSANKNMTFEDLSMVTESTFFWNVALHTLAGVH
jgi:hypothetical protein